MGEEIEKEMVDWVLGSAKRGYSIHKNGLLFAAKKIVDAVTPAEQKELSFVKNQPRRKMV